MPKKRSTYPFLKADIERGLILAYYQLVRGCHVILEDQSGLSDTSLVALAYKPGELIGMDFSSIYHFDEQSKPSTRLRRVKKKLDELERFASLLPVIAGQEYEASRITYEIWCFLPPNRLVTDTVTAAQAENLLVDLITPRRLHERIRQTAMIQPMMKQKEIEQNAFLWAAQLLREADASR